MMSHPCNKYEQIMLSYLLSVNCQIFKAISSIVLHKIAQVLFIPKTFHRDGVPEF